MQFLLQVQLIAVNETIKFKCNYLQEFYKSEAIKQLLYGQRKIFNCYFRFRTS